MSDSDGESAMAYFLPNGIADDSPPKRSTMISSFGSIGKATASPFRPRSTDDSDAHLLGSPLSSGPDFASMLRNQSPAASRSSFPAATASSTPRDDASARSKFLLSDLAGEVHHPQTHRLEEKRDLSTARSFGFPGTIGKASVDADTSSRNMFDRDGGMGLRTSEPMGSKAADRFGFPATSSASSSMYSHPTLTLPSFMNTPTAAQEGSCSVSRLWNEADAKPRRVLHSPPGLSKPSAADNAERRSGLRTDNRFNQRAPRNDGLVLQPHLSPMPESPFANAFTATTSGVSTGFSALSSEFASNLQLSRLQMSPHVFSSPPLELALSKRPVVSNPALAELNSESVLMEELQKPQIVQAEHANGSRSGELPTRELRVANRQKTAKVQRPTTGQQRNGGEEIAKVPSLQQSRNATALRSPVAQSRSGRRSSVLSPSQSQPVSQPNASEMASDRSTKARPKKRGQPASETQTALRYSPTAHLVTTEPSNGAKRKVSEFNWTDQREENANLTGSDSSPNKHSDEHGILKPLSTRTDSSKSGARGVPSKKPAPRSSEERILSSTRRQIYREKLPREPPQSPVIETKLSEVVSILAATSAEQDSIRTQVEMPDTKSSVQCSEEIKQSVCSKDPAEARPRQGEWVTHKKPSRASKGTMKTEAKINLDPKFISSPKNVDAAVNEISAKDEKDSSATTTVLEKERKPKTRGSNKHGIDESGSLAPQSDKKYPTSKQDGNSLKSVPPVSTLENQQVKSKAKLEHVVRQEEPVQLARTEPNPIVPAELDKKKKDKSKKDKSDKKRGGRVKKEKRDSSSSSKGDLQEAVSTKIDSLDASTAEVVKTASVGETIRKWAHSSAEMLRPSVLSLVATFTRGWAWIGAHANVRGWLHTAASNFESVMAVVFSVLLLCSLHGASWFIRIHRVAFRAILTHRHIGFCFAFLYSFPLLVQYVFPWAPPWAPVCLWYAFLVQLFCTSGPTAMVTTFRVILPLVFLLEGISHHSFLLDLNGAELLLASFILSAVKTSNLCSPVFMLSLAIQCLSAVFLGSELVVQWFQMALALYSLHFMATSDEDWSGLSEDDPEVAYHSGSLHHSIADYNQHLAPSATSIHKTKHLDRRALAYVKGRKFR